MNELPSFFIIPVVLVVSLGIYLGILLQKLKEQKQYINKQKELIAIAQKERLFSINESVRVICLGVIQKQCELSEGCVRLVNLCQLVETYKIKENCPKLLEMYEIKDLDFLDGREALSKKEKFKQDGKRLRVEEKYVTLVDIELNTLLGIANTQV